MIPSHRIASTTRRGLALAALALFGFAGTARAQTPTAWPLKPVRIVVGFAPGGGTDVMARNVAQALTSALGQPVIVDNKPGASGNISVSEVSRAVPDGYTFLIGPTTIETANPSLFKSSVAPARDLTPVGTVGRTQMYLIAKPQIAATSIKELVALAKARPDTLSFASSGTGTAPHLACELFKQVTGTSITHVPYRGSSPALMDVMSGQADFVCDPGIAFPHIRAGTVKLLGVVSSRRSPFFPDVPTVSEQGFPGANLDIWFGLWAPNGVAPDILARMNRELAKALAQPALKAHYAELGAEPVAMDTAEFRKLLADETRQLTTLIRDQKITVD